MSASFVFYDPSGRRWNRFRRGFGVAGVVLAVALVLFGLSVLSNPQLPNLGLPNVEHLANFTEVKAIIRGERSAKNIPFQFRKSADLKYVKNGGNPVLHPKTVTKAREDQPLVFGFYVNWDPSSMVSFRLNLANLTHLVPEWLTLQNAGGDLTDETDGTVVTIAADAKLPILAMVTNYRNGWQAGDLHHVLTNSTARANLIENIYNNLVEHKFAGVMIDFEQLTVRDRKAMVDFMEALRTRLQDKAFVLAESVPTSDNAYDLKKLSAIDDYIVPMVYDEHYQSGTPGPVASEPWFDGQLETLAKILPPKKTVIGIGNYGYDWTIGGSGAAEVSYGDTIAAASSNKAEVLWDKDTANPVLRYKSDSGQHEVWFLDAVTALNQIQDTNDAGFRGVGLWRLGGEDPGLWSVLAKHSWPEDNFKASSLFHLTAQKSVEHYGEGETLRIASTPRDGKRNVWKSDDDYLEQYQAYPSYYVVEHTGNAPKDQVSLSFDDGPSEYTSEILDILKAKKVPATFFVVGINAEQDPSIIKRMYAEGHTIGNHTYTHPNIAKESEERTYFELNTTQRLIEHDVGRATKLFRPPYNADSEPTTPDEIVPILRAQNRGYITIGERIDPRDWQANITSDAILKEVLAEKDSGHIILLHDGGGDRSATVAALPKIIDELRAQGYHFVGVNQLLGKTRDDLMPIPSKDEERWAQIEGGALVTKGNFKKVVGLLFLGAIYLTLLRSLVYGTLAIMQKVQAGRRKFDPTYCPGVSVVIAAYNEETVIARTVQSVLDNGYGDIEVVVVDDGSKDATLKILHREFGANSCVRILTQLNQGKAAALNAGIEASKNNILVAVDADTIFRKGTIENLVRHFADPKVGAVSGNARVGNRHNWLTRFQSIEYICGFNLDRRALDRLNAITVVPGAVGAWRKDLINMVGDFNDDTLAEDTDITLSLRRLGYKIRYEQDAIAYTEAPENTKALAKQRFRWAFGTLQAAWKHRDATFNPSYGFLGMVALPSIWIFQVLLALLSPFAEIAMIIGLFAGNWRIVLLYYFALFLLEFATAILAYSLERAEPWDLALLFFQRIYYRQLMHYVLGKSMVYAMKGRLVGWGKLERHASVSTT